MFFYFFTIKATLTFLWFYYTCTTRQRSIFDLCSTIQRRFFQFSQFRQFQKWQSEFFRFLFSLLTSHNRANISFLNYYYIFYYNSNIKSRVRFVIIIDTSFFYKIRRRWTTHPESLHTSSPASNRLFIAEKGARKWRARVSMAARRIKFGKMVDGNFAASEGGNSRRK